MPQSLRPYQETDFDDLVSLWVDTWRPTFGPYWLDDFVEAWRQQLSNLTETAAEIIISEDEDGLSGTLILLPETCKIDQLFIHPRVQRQGLGQNFLDHARHSCPQHIWLTVFTFNDKAIQFYQKQDFICTREYISEASGLPLFELHWTA